MFKKSQSDRPLDLFSNVLNHLPASVSKKLLREESWHNVFYKEVIAPFPESIFSVLYSSKMGRPNMPVRLLVGFLILKEGHGWTDEQLFEEVVFNLQVRWALGLRNLNDKAPGESTYYDFKQSLQQYHKETGKDLLEEAFEKITAHQLKKYKINGKHFRMDAKLYNSNIATSNLVRLLSETLQLFLRDLSDLEKSWISAEHKEVLEQLNQYSSDGIAYRMTKEEKQDYIQQCGSLLLHLTEVFKDTGGVHYPLLVRLLSEQYDVVDSSAEEPPTQDNSTGSTPNITQEGSDVPQEDVPQVSLKDRGQINGSTLQSPHDPQAAYRKKENGSSVQEIRGYSSNIGETCHPDNSFNLITTITTAPVTIQDNDYVKKSIEQTQRVTGGVDTSWMDGAYSSATNRNWLEEKGITAYFPALAGYEGHHHFEWVNSSESSEPILIVTDLRDGKKYKAQLTRCGKKYRITYDHLCKDGRKFYRYFTQQELANYEKRRQIEQLPKEILNRRANVEGTIHQVFCKMGKKSRYRGLLPNHFMVLGRSFWTNCRRITKYAAKQAHEAAKIAFLLLCRLVKHLIRFFAFLTFTSCSKHARQNLILLFQ